MRAISTVVDVAIFLLLVSAAVATLTMPTTPAADAPVDPTTEALGTVTANVTYNVTAGNPLGSALPEENRRATRSVNGSVAMLLARAAVNDARIEGTHVGLSRSTYTRHVRSAVKNVTRFVDHPVRIEATWVPYVGAPMRGSMTIGPTPPGEAVSLATLTVPAPIPDARSQAGKAASAGYSAVANETAAAVLNGTLPPNRIRPALQGQGRAELFARERYAGFSRALTVAVTPAVDADRPSRANARLADHLGALFAADMRRQFVSPNEAAAAVRTGTVRITVRGWPA